MWRLMTDMTHDKSWVMGVLEPIILLLVIAIVAASGAAVLANTQVPLG